MAEKIRNISLIFILFGILLFIFISAVLGINWHGNLYGVANFADKPELNITNVINGEFQNKYNAWYLENYPFRNAFLRTYNQIRYTVFNDAGDTEFMGNDGYILNKIHFKLHTNIEQTNIDYEKYARELAYVQKEMKKRGKVLIYLPTPDKLEMCLNEMPELYKYIYSKHINENTTYDKLINSFDKFSVYYFDSINYLKNLDSKYPVFYKTGLHWSYYAAARVEQGLFKKINEDFNMKLNIFNIDSVYTGDATETDKDLYYLQNFWKGKADDVYYHVGLSGIKNDSDMLIYGTSFGVQVYETLKLANAFRKLSFFQYYTYERSYFENKEDIKTFDNTQDANSIGLIDAAMDAKVILLLEDSYRPGALNNGINALYTYLGGK